MSLTLYHIFFFRKHFYTTTLILQWPGKDSSHCVTGKISFPDSFESKFRAGRMYTIDVDLNISLFFLFSFAFRCLTPSWKNVASAVKEPLPWSRWSLAHKNSPLPWPWVSRLEKTHRCNEMIVSSMNVVHGWYRHSVSWFFNSRNDTFA